VIEENNRNRKKRNKKKNWKNRGEKKSKEVGRWSLFTHHGHTEALNSWQPKPITNHWAVTGTKLCRGTARKVALHVEQVPGGKKPTPSETKKPRASTKN